MRKSSLFAVLFVVLCSPVDAQFFFYDDKYLDNDLLFEAGASFGIMNCMTDVGANKGGGLKAFDWKSMKMNVSVYGAIMYKSIVEGRLELTRGSVAGNDANSDSRYANLRNLSFKSRITELSLTGIFHPIMLFDLESLPIVSPYVMAGIGVFSFYPKALYNGEWVPLRMQNTEGQGSDQFPSRKQYNLRALSYPIGLGLKYEYSAKINFRIEGVYRFTSTDYLDDVSTTFVDRSIFPTEMSRILAHRYLEKHPFENLTGRRRGNQNVKDHFFSLNLKAGYVIGREKRPSARGK